MQELEEENKELQHTINRLKESSEKLAHEVTQALDQQESDFAYEVIAPFHITISLYSCYMFRKRKRLKSYRKSMMKSCLI